MVIIIDLMVVVYREKYTEIVVNTSCEVRNFVVYVKKIFDKEDTYFCCTLKHVYTNHCMYFPQYNYCMKMHGLGIMQFLVHCPLIHGPVEQDHHADELKHYSYINNFVVTSETIYEKEVTVKKYSVFKTSLDSQTDWFCSQT